MLFTTHLWRQFLSVHAQPHVLRREQKPSTSFLQWRALNKQFESQFSHKPQLQPFRAACGGLCSFNKTTALGMAWPVVTTSYSMLADIIHALSGNSSATLISRALPASSKMTQSLLKGHHSSKFTRPSGRTLIGFANLIYSSAIRLKQLKPASKSNNFNWRIIASSTKTVLENLAQKTEKTSQKLTGGNR